MPPPLILIVDDNPENLTVLGELLQPGHAVRVANSGVRALRMARLQPRPDLILLDVMMPEMDGYDVLAELRSQPETAGIPVIFLSALNDPVDVQRGLRVGALDFISKPVRPDLLLARVRAGLAAAPRGTPSPAAVARAVDPTAPGSPLLLAPDRHPLERTWRRVCAMADRAPLASRPDRTLPVALREGAAPAERLQAARLALPCLQERWDGSGYPDGLAGSDIPWLARLWAVAQAYETALAIAGPGAAGPDAARRSVLAQSGHAYDPQAVQALMATLAPGLGLPAPAEARV